RAPGAGPAGRSAGPHHAFRTLAGGRLHDAPHRHGRRPVGQRRLPHHCFHVQPVGYRGRHHPGDRGADPGGRRREVRTPMNDTLIEAQGLTKRYGGTLAVDDISFQVGRGEIFGLLGPNGAGKTTTILMLLGLTDTSAGTVRVMGRDPQRDPLGVKRQLGYLPDAVGFYDYLSARDNLAYTARLLGLDAGERASRIDRALARMRLSEVSGRRVATYSRGMRQRLGLAEIVMKDARVAILDEPTSGLDPQSTEEFLDLI